MDHRVNIEENEKRVKYLDFARERKERQVFGPFQRAKKLWTMKVTDIVVIYELGMVTKGLERGLVWFGLVWFLLFNGISTFLGYLMPNLSFYKDSSGTI